MSIKSIKTGYTGISALAGNPAYGDFESIATTVVGSGGTSTITFSNIPTSFQHLQIRGIGRNTNSNTGAQILYVNLNQDTTSGNYTKHNLFGNGTSGGSYGGANDAGYDGMTNATYTASVFTGYVIDILDYQNTNKYKTVRALLGFDSNSLGSIYLTSNLWKNTNAVTSISITTSLSGNLAEHSSFALYGIKG